MDISVLLGGDSVFPGKFLAEMQQIAHALSHKLKTVIKMSAGPASVFRCPLLG